MADLLTIPKGTETSAGELTAAEIEWIDRSVIDASVRTPVMFFFTTAQTWLLAATVIGFICSMTKARIPVTIPTEKERSRLS